VLRDFSGEGGPHLVTCARNNARGSRSTESVTAVRYNMQLECGGGHLVGHTTGDEAFADGVPAHFTLAVWVLSGRLTPSWS
jgi:hypothetical protein